MIDEAKLEELIASTCKVLSVEEWEYMTSASTSFFASMVDQEVVESSSARDCSISLRVIADGREGTASSEKLDESIVPRLVASALANSRVKAVQEGYVPEVYKGDTSYPEKMDPGRNYFSAGEVKAVLASCQEHLFSLDGRVSSGTGSDAASIKSSTRLVNSAGLSLCDDYASSYIISEAVVRQDGDVRNAYESGEGDISTIGTDEAVWKAIRKLGAGTVKSGRYPVVLSGDCLRLFLSTYSPAFSGRNAFLGLSPYKDRIGDEVASPIVSLIDDPLYPGYPGQRTWDGEGRATWRKAVIDRGRLNTLLYNREWALRSGTESTGNAAMTGSGSIIRPYSFHIAAGSLSFDELVANAGDGVYVTDMKGFHAGADPVSGDFSIESSGFLIEHGQVSRPVQGFTVSGNFFTMLGSIKALSDQVRWAVTLGAMRTGSPDALIEGLSVSGE